MSVIHWDKSVLSLHLKEILEDHHRGDSTALLGLGAIVVGAIALPTTLKVGKPLLKSLIKTGLSLQSQVHPPRTPPLKMTANIQRSQKSLQESLPHSRHF